MVDNRVTRRGHRLGLAGCVAGAEGLEATPQKEKETPLKKQADKQHGTAVGEKEVSAESGDIIIGPLVGEYSAPQDLNLDDLWVEFVKQAIKAYKARIERDVKAAAKSTDTTISSRPDIKDLQI